MGPPAAEPPQDAEDLRRLIAKLERLASTDTRKAPVYRELVAKLTAQLRHSTSERRRSA